jgi:hypothetical protein
LFWGKIPRPYEAGRATKTSADQRLQTGIHISEISSGKFPLLLGQVKSHVEKSVHFDGLAIQQGGAEAPLQHSFARGTHKNRVAADLMELLNRAVARDYGAQLNHSLEMNLTGDGRIDGLHAMNQ